MKKHQMTTHHYNPPERKTSSWGGLSDEAKAALSQVAMGPSIAKDLLSNDTPDAAAQGIESLLRPNVLEWARRWLDDDSDFGAFGCWREYETAIGLPIPHNVDELLQTNPNLVDTLYDLYDARQDLMVSGVTTPEGVNVGETMTPVAVPWQALSDHRLNLEEWINAMRQQRGHNKAEFIYSGLLRMITEDRPLYRDVSNPSHLLTSTEYLTQKIEQDGPWGVVLAQSIAKAGVNSAAHPFGSLSPDALTNHGADHFKLAGQVVDSMGIYEWISLTLQQKPPQPSTEIQSMMLANRFEGSSGPVVPFGAWGTNQVMSDLIRPDIDFSDVRPHLMVM